MEVVDVKVGPEMAFESIVSMEALFLEASSDESPE